MTAVRAIKGKDITEPYLWKKYFMFEDGYQTSINETLFPEESGDVCAKFLSKAVNELRHF